MACYHPIAAYRTADGSVVFSQLRRYDICSSIELPCGQCVGCRLERSRQWAMRCLHESSLYERNCFITLTYDEAHLPPDASLDYSHFQNFMKRLRFKFRGTRIRFYMCGEYGENFGRPHFHACLFNVDFDDKRVISRRDGVTLYSSQLLSELWPFGFSSIGDVTFESAAYVARYIMKKITGDAAESHYRIVDSDTGEIRYRTPEFNHMSLKPGIGSEWLERYSLDVFPLDYVVIRGVKVKPPKYYDRLIKRALDWYPHFIEADSLHDDLIESRVSRGVANRFDNTDARLAVREQVALARLSLLPRTME